ncbi:MAG: hypothetical protein IIA59_03995 [Candidatus Marinimicrobia bacterium]|nr:hypothetical protein [Candidatus Neomarinimicrobiota bacterium]
MAAIEKGIDVPFASQAPTLSYRNRGIVWIALGLVMVRVLWALTGEFSVASVGLIPIAYGVASLWIALSAKHKDGEG